MIRLIGARRPLMCPRKKDTKVSSISVVRNEKTDRQADDLSQDIASSDTSASDEVVDDSAKDQGVRVDVSKKKSDDADDEPTSTV